MQFLKWLQRLWWRFLAWNRLSNWAICEMSKGLPKDADYHDYKGDASKFPDHFATLKCERCKKEFTI